MKEIGYGSNYQYSHDFPGHFSPQDYLPESLGHPLFYEPGLNQSEEKYVSTLKQLWKGKYPY
jgi:putative ATPase